EASSFTSLACQENHGDGRRWPPPGQVDVERRVHNGGTSCEMETTVTYVIAQPCVDLKDLSCVDECPVDCIYEGNRMLYIQPDECVDCGACEPVCPVEAIFYEDDTPEEWAEYYDANVH